MSVGSEGEYNFYYNGVPLGENTELGVFVVDARSDEVAKESGTGLGMELAKLLFDYAKVSGVETFEVLTKILANEEGIRNQLEVWRKYPGEEGRDTLVRGTNFVQAGFSLRLKALAETRGLK